MEVYIMKKERALVVFSGGQDSTTCLFQALKQYEEVEVVTLNYGQRHAQELEVARDIASELGVKHHELDLSLLSQLTSNALTDHSQTITTNEDGLPSTFVDGRNHLFLSFAAVLAKGRGIRHIVTGV